MAVVRCLQSLPLDVEAFGVYKCVLAAWGRKWLVNTRVKIVDGLLILSWSIVTALGIVVWSGGSEPVFGRRRNREVVLVTGLP